MYVPKQRCLQSTKCINHEYNLQQNLLLPCLPAKRIWRVYFQKLACQIAPSPSPQRWCTSSILSTDLHMPLQLQSNDAAQVLPASAFHSQSSKNIYIITVTTIHYSLLGHFSFSYLRIHVFGGRDSGKLCDILSGKGRELGLTN